MRSQIANQPTFEKIICLYLEDGICKPEEVTCGEVSIAQCNSLRKKLLTEEVSV
jgi:hypothetical protein